MGAVIGLCGTVFVLAAITIAAVLTKATRKPKRKGHPPNNLSKEEEVDPEMMKNISEGSERGKS